MNPTTLTAPTSQIDQALSLAAQFLGFSCPTALINFCSGGSGTVKYDPDDLPESIRFVEEVIGFEATLSLMHYHGGRRLYVPKSINPKHQLVQQLGMGAVQKLSKKFGGQILSVPRNAKMLKAVRNRALVSDYNQGEGLSVAKLAKKYDLCDRRVSAILNNEAAK